MPVMDAPVELYRDPNHKYWFGRENYLGVNETISGLGLEEDRFYTPGSSEKGRVEHIVLAGVARGLVFDMDLLDPDCRGNVGSGMLRLEALLADGAVILGVEVMGYHPVYKFAGQIDIHYLWRGYEWIGDWKGGKASPFTRFKMGAYDLILGPTTNGLQRKKVVFELQDDGSIARPVYYNEPCHFHDGMRFVAYHTTMKDKRLYGPKERNS